MLKTFFVLLLISTQAFAKTCQEIHTRAAFDIGSGTTKMKVYRYNPCLETMQTITDKKCEEDIAVAYKEDLKSDNLIKETTIQSGINAIKKFKKIALSCGATQFAAVATSAFRQAKNGKDAASKLSKANQVAITVISQTEEAMLGYQGALSKLTSEQRKDLCVWDIGGSSMQIVCSHKKVPYIGKIASVSFKNMLIANKPTARQRQLDTPNPITSEDYQYAHQITKKTAHQIEKVLDHRLQSQTVYGIGGVHYYSIAKTIDLKSFGPQDLTKYIEKNMLKTDTQLEGGPYASTALSNLLLVEGLMHALKISKVTALKVNLTEGLVASPQYWKLQRIH